MSNDIISALELLREHAASAHEMKNLRTNSALKQRICLIEVYGVSLLRRRDARLMALEEARDEVAIALVGRAPPIVFWIGEEKSTGSKVPSPSIASIKLAGKCQSTYILKGEFSFGTQVACHVACNSQKAGATPMVEEPGCY
jgi:hypothetical protein